MNERMKRRLTGLALKRAVAAVSASDLVLYGEQTVSEVPLVEGDRVLVNAQADPAENGIYVVSTGAWTRALDWNGSGDVVQGTLVLHAGNLYRVTTANPIVVGVSAVSLAPLIVAQDEELPIHKTKGTSSQSSVDTTYQSDDFLAGFQIGAAKYYLVRGMLIYSTNGSSLPDLNFRLEFTQTVQFISLRAWELAGVGATTINDGDSSVANAVGVSTTRGGMKCEVFQGVFLSHATLAGTMDLQWSQRVLSAANPVIILPGSYLEITPFTPA